MSDDNKQQVYRDAEIKDWIDSLDDVLKLSGPGRVAQLLHELDVHAHKAGVRLPFTANTPYINTIPASEQPAYPGNRELEWRIKSLVRWNAMAMVVRANKLSEGIGGHISTYASAATLYEVGFNHFFRARSDSHPGDVVYYQGHATPGIYARAFLEGRLSTEKLENFRRELKPGGGLSSYPHPWLMPDFWRFPTVSMGLGPIMAIYRARFIRYLEDRGLIPKTDQKVWAFLGDGETDEPETLGAITLAAREKLDNLVFVINCNLQRLDGPVRGNGKIIQELEAAFRGAGWNAIKVVWGADWDPLLDKDKDGLLVKRMGEVVDGQYQKYTVSEGDYIREHFFGTDPRLLDMVKHLSDEKLMKIRRGGHDPEKVYAAYQQATMHEGGPTVILAKTVKGYGMGEAGEGRNITHGQKKLNEEELAAFRTRFGIPVSDEDLAQIPFYKPADDSPEMEYLHARRKALGGYVPSRKPTTVSMAVPKDDVFEEFYKGTDGHEVSTTMAFVRMLSKLLKDKEIGKQIVPIVPDEARTFGMEALFRQVGIYSHAGQLYEPVDADSLLYYKESQSGQLLEEGINEAGSLSSFIAAGTSYAVSNVNMIPFFIYYSMFGFQRVGDLVWAAGDMRCKGFLVGGTAGRTTLAGEGLQHQDGHSHLLAYPVPNLVTYDPAFAYEIAVIVQDGIRRMYHEGEDIFYYFTVMNENYVQPPMPKDCRDGILKGAYKLSASGDGKSVKAQILGSGAILNEALKAQKMLAETFGIATDVWSVTSYKELRRNAKEVERWNMLNPGEERKTPYVSKCFGKAPGVFVAASDYVKTIPDSIARWLPGPLHTLGTDGFGRSESREALRDFFEVDARYIVLATLHSLAKQGEVDVKVVKKAVKDLGISPDKANPLIS
ncbi:MAG: pyruvate dehydrogenase (acetyl-transferring), homodimeric type [Verrucomicrobia bacterium]|nr:pyruvate dehydrogenase (acetyl-transferring), homodimeric type [Verrucomicrobiota bacterium]